MPESLEIVRSLARLRELEPRLWALFWRDPGATPFQSPAWLLPWCESMARSAELAAFVTFRSGEGNELSSFLPTVICTTGAGKVLRLAGYGESDYLGGL